MASNAHSEYLAKLPADWERVPVRALGTVYAGGTPSRDIPRYWNGTISWITPAEITQLESKYLSKTNERITYEGLARCAAKLLPKGSLLVTTRATIGGVAVSKLPVCTNQGFKNIVPNEISNVDFYYHLFSIIVPELLRLASGSTFPEINQRNFEAIIVPRPSKEEQRRIAEILDTIDEAIQKTEALISKLKAMKQGLLQDLLTRGLDKNGKLRDPKAHPEQFKDSPLGRIPKEWHTTQLAKIVIRAEYGISVSLEDNSGIPVLRMNNLVAGEVDLSALKYSKSREASNLLLNPRDVLFNRTNSMEHVGRTAIWRGQLEGISFASYLVRIVPDYSKLIPEYLNLWLNSQSTQILIRKYATPSVHQVNINPTNLQKSDITLPQSLEEQYAIVDVVEAHDAHIRTEEQYRDKLKLQKKGLMHDLLTGKVRVKT